MGRHAGRVVTSQPEKARRARRTTTPDPFDPVATRNTMRITMTTIGVLYAAAMLTLMLAARIPFPYAWIPLAAGLTGGTGAMLPAWLLTYDW